MSGLLINPAKNTFIASLLESTFTAIKSTNNLTTPYVTPRTIAYIHALIIDTVTALPTDTVNQRALQT